MKDSCTPDSKTAGKPAQAGPNTPGDRKPPSARDRAPRRADANRALGARRWDATEPKARLLAASFSPAPQSSPSPSAARLARGLALERVKLGARCQWRSARGRDAPNRNRARRPRLDQILVFKTRLRRTVVRFRCKSQRSPEPLPGSGIRSLPRLVVALYFDRQLLAAPARFAAPAVTTQPARAAYESVLKEAGATLPQDRVSRLARG